MNNKETLMQAFIATDLPVGHLEAFKQGAAKGHLDLKRSIVDFIDRRLLDIDVLQDSKELTAVEAEIARWELFQLRDLIRNVLLFKRE